MDGPEPKSASNGDMQATGLLRHIHVPPADKHHLATLVNLL